MSLSKRLSQEIFSSTFVTHWAAISWAVRKRKKWVSQWSGAFNKRTPSLGFPSRFSSYDSVFTSSPGLILVRELRPWKLRETAKKKDKEKGTRVLNETPKFLGHTVRTGEQSELAGKDFVVCVSRGLRCLITPCQSYCFRQIILLG